MNALFEEYLEEFDQMVKEEPDFCATALWVGAAAIGVLSFLPPMASYLVLGGSLALILVSILMWVKIR